MRTGVARAKSNQGVKTGSHKRTKQPEGGHVLVWKFKRPPSASMMRGGRREGVSIEYYTVQGLHSLK